jgi:hypothetical protein
LSAGLGLCSASTTNLSAALDLHSASCFNSNKTRSAFQPVANEHKHLIKANAKTFWLIVSFKQQYQSKMQQRVVNFSLLNAISITKLDINTDFQRAAMSYSNYDFQLIVDLTLIAYRAGARAVLISPYSAFERDQNLSSASDDSIMFSLTSIHIQQLIVTSHYSKTFLHFSKDSAIFCEVD